MAKKKKEASGATTLSMLVAEIEGKKVSLNIAQIREVVGIISDLAFFYPGVVECLIANGRRRNKG